jgi:hypothetical protein
VHFGREVLDSTASKYVDNLNSRTAENARKEDHTNAQLRSSPRPIDRVFRDSFADRALRL